MDCTCLMGYCARHAHPADPPQQQQQPRIQLQQILDQQEVIRQMARYSFQQPMMNALPIAFPNQLPLFPGLLQRMLMGGEGQNQGGNNGQQPQQQWQLVVQLQPQPQPEPELPQEAEEVDEDDEPLRIHVTTQLLHPKTIELHLNYENVDANPDQTPNFFPSFVATWHDISYRNAVVINIVATGCSYLQTIKFERLEYSVGTNQRDADGEENKTREYVCQRLGLDAKLDHCFYVFVKCGFETLQGQVAEETESCLKCIQLE